MVPHVQCGGPGLALFLLPSFLYSSEESLTSLLIEEVFWPGWSLIIPATASDPTSQAAEGTIAVQLGDSVPTLIRCPFHQ